MSGGSGNDAYCVNNIGDVVTEGTSGGIDTVWSFGRSTKPDLIHLLQLLLHNDCGNIFNRSEHRGSSLAAGLWTRRQAGGEKLIGRVASHSYEKDSSYQKPLRRIPKRDDIEHDPNLMLERGG